MHALFSSIILLSYVCYASAVFNSTQCGLTKQCFTKPAHCSQKGSTTECDMAFTWKKTETTLDLELYTKANLLYGQTTGQYIAIGFSHDQQMGDDVVLTCLYTNINTPVTTTRWAWSINEKEKSNQFQRFAKGIKTGTFNLVRYNDGEFKCKISFDLPMVLLDFVPSELNALDKEHYLFMTTGTFKGGTDGNNVTIDVHPLDGSSKYFPQISSKQIKVFDVDFVAGGGEMHILSWTLLIMGILFIFYTNHL